MHLLYDPFHYYPPTSVSLSLQFFIHLSSVYRTAASTKSAMPSILYEVISATGLGRSYGWVLLITLQQHETEAWIQKDLQTLKPYSSRGCATTYLPNLTKHCEYTESHNDLKPLPQYEEEHQVYLQVLNVSSPGYPADVPPMIYILFICAAAYCSPHFFAVSVTRCWSSQRAVNIGGRHITFFTNCYTLKLNMSSGKCGGHAIRPARASHSTGNDSSK